MRHHKPSSVAALGLLSIAALLLPVLAGTIGASAFVPICDTDCTPPPGGGWWWRRGRNPASPSPVVQHGPEQR